METVEIIIMGGAVQDVVIPLRALAWASGAFLILAAWVIMQVGK